VGDKVALPISRQVGPARSIAYDIDLSGTHRTQLVRRLVPHVPETWLVMVTISRSERDLLDGIRAAAPEFESRVQGARLYHRSIHAHW
jgi:hypothetical protein